MSNNIYKLFIYSFIYLLIGASLDKSSTDGEKTLRVHRHCSERQQNHQVGAPLDTHTQTSYHDRTIDVHEKDMHSIILFL